MHHLAILGGAALYQIFWCNGVGIMVFNHISTYSRERIKAVELFPRTDSAHKIHY